MMYFSGVRAGVLALSIVLSLVATGGLARAQQLPTVRVIALPIDSGSQPFIAQAMGFFKKAGINVEIVASENNGSAVAAAVASKAADIGQSNVISIATARERGLPFVLVAGSKLFVAALHQNALIVAAASPIKTAHDLVGKTIAVNGLRNISEIGVDAWLDDNGTPPASVKMVEMPFSTMAASVASGRADAALLTQPDLESALAAKTVRVLSYPYESITKQFLVGCWFATSQWASEHPDLVRAYASAMQQTAEWANSHRPETAKIIETMTKTTVQVSALPRYSTQLDARDIQPLIDAAAKYGAIKATVPAAQLTAGASAPR
jgi:NitT/TauT family transport system substrate-binding protein